MKKLQDLSGNKYGKLLVLKREYSDNLKQGVVWYKCLCDCGKEKFVRGPSLNSGNSKSCGCSRTESIRRKQGKKPFEYLYNLMAYNSRKRNQELLLSYEDYLKFTEITSCHYCGANIKWAKYACDRPNKSYGYGYNLDRKDNMKGYSTNNCVVCCRRCNWSRSDNFSYEEWVIIGKVISTFS